jgi:hypothetical protein
MKLISAGGSISITLICCILVSACKKGSSVGNLSSTVSTLAGSGGSGETNGAGSAATFSELSGMTVDGSGNIFVCDSSEIREITPDGTVTTAAYAEEFALADVRDPGIYYTPGSIAADNSGHVYAPNGPSNQIFYVIPFQGTMNNGIVYSYAGSLLGTAGDADGTAIINSLNNSGLLNNPFCITFDKSTGGLYFADESEGMCIRKITADGTISHLVSVANFPGNPTHLDISALACDNEGNIYMADDYDRKIWKITAAGSISLFLNTSTSIWLIVTDNDDNLYMSDLVRIWRVTPSGQLSFVAGGNSGSADGPGSTAGLSHIGGIAVAGNGNLYVSDNGNRVIRKIVIQ